MMGPAYALKRDPSSLTLKRYPARKLRPYQTRTPPTGTPLGAGQCARAAHIGVGALPLLATSRPSTRRLLIGGRPVMSLMSDGSVTS